MPDTFAVLREPASEMNLRLAASAMAEALGGVAMDHVARLRDAPGVLARNLGQEPAEAFARALGQQGIGTFVLPESKMAFPPDAEDIREGRVEEEGFRFQSEKGPMLVPWGEILLMDCAMVRFDVERKVKEFRTRPEWLRDYSGGLGMRFGRGAFLVRHNDPEQPRKETVSAWREVLDLICYDPWAHVRIDRENFNYRSAGMPLHPTNHLNFSALAVMIKARAEKAECGPGMSLLLDGQPATRAKAPSLAAYENDLLWRLQLLWR